MIKFNRTAFIISTVVLLTSVGCSNMNSFFPDKEKDYQFRSEIAPLTVPSNLTERKIKPLPSVYIEKAETEDVVMIGEMVEEDGYVITSTAEPEVTVTDEEVPEEAVIFDDTPPIEFVMFDGGATRLRINDRLDPAWRLVAKALTRNRIEIINRNQAAGQLIVQYDPNLTDFKDKTVADEFSFIFGEDHSQEKEYRIRVMEHNNSSEVIILDSKDQPLSNGIGLDLLKLLFTTIHADLTAQK